MAPLWAALVALINSAKGTPAGYLNPTLYKNPGVLHDISQGNNGAFSAVARMGRMHWTWKSRRNESGWRRRVN